MSRQVKQALPHSMPQPELPAAITRLLPEEALHAASGLLSTRLAGDGSGRVFHRIRTRSFACLAVLPDPQHPMGPEAALREARAAIHIGRHLGARGVPVPGILAADPESGALLFEDLGDTLLHNRVTAEGHSPEVFALYRLAVEELARMQVAGAAGFDTGWCWDTPRYDRELMLARESGYFTSAFCEGLLGISTPPAAVRAEFLRLADAAGEAPASFFLHRDFQGRNIMVQDDRVRVIDFQGARLGPLGYDLTSLLHDPYVQLPAAWKDTLLFHYIRSVQGMIPLDREVFLGEYYALSLQRNLQVLGAFAFLSRVRGKPFFRQYLRPALANLASLLEAPRGTAYPSLRGFVAELGVHPVINTPP